MSQDDSLEAQLLTCQEEMAHVQSKNEQLLHHISLLESKLQQVSPARFTHIYDVTVSIATAGLTKHANRAQAEGSVVTIC